MKKRLSILLIFAILLSLAACRAKTKIDLEQPVKFYYPRTSFQYGADSGVFAYEMRESKHYKNYEDNLLPLLQAYLMGPMNDGLQNPFPEDLIMVNYRWDHQRLIIVLSSDFSSLNNIDLTLACSSLALTCFSLTDADSVQISSSNIHSNQSKSVILYRDQLLLKDEVVHRAEN